MYLLYVDDIPAFTSTDGKEYVEYKLTDIPDLRPFGDTYPVLKRDIKGINKFNYLVMDIGVTVILRNATLSLAKTKEYTIVEIPSLESIKVVIKWLSQYQNSHQTTKATQLFSSMVEAELVKQQV